MTTEKEVDTRWVYLTVYDRSPSFHLYKTLAEDWDKMTEEERQQELYDASVELGWHGDFDYTETKRANK